LQSLSSLINASYEVLETLASERDPPGGNRPPAVRFARPFMQNARRGYRFEEFQPLQDVMPTPVARGGRERHASCK
jgi:hypothetical protein